MQLQERNNIRHGEPNSSERRQLSKKKNLGHWIGVTPEKVLKAETMKTLDY